MEGSVITDKAIGMLDSLQEAAKQITTKLIDTAPKAFEIICNIKTIDSLQLIALGIGFVALSVFFAFVLKTIINQGDEEFAIFVGTFTFVPCAIASLIFLFNMWNWIGVFNPELAIAKDLYQAAIDKVNK